MLKSSRVFWVLLCLVVVHAVTGQRAFYSSGYHSVAESQSQLTVVSSSNGNDVKKIIVDAVAIVQAENEVFRDRFLKGIDKKLEEHETVEPILFIEIVSDNEDRCYKSRVINWIARLARERNILKPLTQILRHTEAHRLQITCPFTPPPCGSFTPYRSIDGTCNNPRRPYMGAGFTPFTRESEPSHESGSTYINGATYQRDDLPRSRGANGRELPNPREISVQIHQAPSNTNPESTCSFMFTLWGQFLAHDLADRAAGKGYKQVPLECCDQSVKTPSGVCSNIDVPSGDFFRHFGRHCLSFIRSSEVTDYDCVTGKREVLNQASAFIDGGSIYGNTLAKLRSIRSFSGGLLTTSQPNSLPISSHPNAKAAAQGFAFFLAGDDRVNEFTGLIGIETIWMREHNRIATILGEYNPRWNDEKIFLETRRIIIAMLQHITYNEYLPKTIPKDLLVRYDLELESHEYYHGYDSAVDPSISNLFSTAAYRFGHSMMRTDFNLLKEDFSKGTSPVLSLQDLFFKPIIYLQNENDIIRGMTSDASDACDRIITKDFVNHLYQTKQGNGFDLPAFNIQRARDHGIQGYNYWRKHYGLQAARSFTTNRRTGFVDHNRETVLKFKALYHHPDDVDVWTGGVSELPISGSVVVGPLFANIIANQFRALRRGDRFWYENNIPGGLTLDQIREIRKVTMSRILCDHIDFIAIQPKAFTVPTEPGNSRISCHSIPKIDLNKWRDTY